jgi:hypothetical protein
MTSAQSLPCQLILTYKMADERRTHVQRASRICIDGSGSLVMCADDGWTRTITVRDLVSLRIQTTAPAA